MSSPSEPTCEECGSPYPVQGWCICVECIHKLDAKGVSRRQIQNLPPQVKGQLDMLDLLKEDEYE